MKKIEEMTPDEIRQKQQQEIEDSARKLSAQVDKCKVEEQKAYEKYIKLRKKTGEARGMFRAYCERYNLEPLQMMGKSGKYMQKS